MKTLLALLVVLIALPCFAADTLTVSAKWPNGTLQPMHFITGKALYHSGGHDTLWAWRGTDTMGVFREGYDSLKIRWGWIQVGTTQYDSTMPNPNNFRADSLAVNGRKLIAYTPNGQLETNLDSMNFARWRTPVVAVNILTNGSFESGSTDWSHYQNGGANNLFSVVTTTPVADGTYKARIVLDAVIGTNNQIYHRGIPLTAGSKYRLTFSAYSLMSNTMQVRVIQGSTPYAIYGFNFQTINLTTNWQTFQIDFTGQNFVGSTTDVMLQFYFVGSTPSTAIFIDGVSIVRLDT